MASRAAVAILVCALLAGCAGQDAGGDAAGAPSSEGLTLRGVVVDEAIRPVAGAAVLAGGGLNATTDGEGAFELTGLTAGVYVVTASKRGFADATTQVVLAETQETPPVKLVLLADASTVAYAETYTVEGFVECGVHFVVGYFAACSGPNTVSTVACPATGVCAGNVTGDHSLILFMVPRQPDWVQMEAVWDATVETARTMMVQSGATSPEEVSTGGVRILNETVGPSPNLNILAGADLEESGIGVDSYVYMRLHTAPNAPAGAGLAVQQPFKLLIHVFYGYTPTEGWRFSEDPQVPPPPA